MRKGKRHKLGLADAYAVLTAKRAAKLHRNLKNFLDRLVSAFYLRRVGSIYDHDVGVHVAIPSVAETRHLHAVFFSDAADTLEQLG